MSGERVIICGGGTGGHLYPALAVGSALRAMRPDLGILFVGSHREVERRIMERYGVDFVPMRIEGLKGRGLRRIPAMFILLGAFLRSSALLRREKPDLVIGAGGYSSGPIVLLASRRRIPTIILEQNALPGFTNRLLARRVDRAVVAFQATAAVFGSKGVYLGNPVREEFEHLPAKPEHDGLDVLVFGGSQGSRFLNRAVTDALPLLAREHSRLRLTHQTGEQDLEWVREKYREAGFAESEVAPYFQDMPDRFTAADLIVCRSGATTCAEIIAARKAAVFVPFAGAADDHQTRNARELEKVGGAVVLSEAEASPEKLAGAVLRFIDDKEALKRMGRGLDALRTDGAAGKIAGLCLELMAGREKRGRS